MLIDLEFSNGAVKLEESNLVVEPDKSSYVDFSVTTGRPFATRVWIDEDGVVITLRRDGRPNDECRWRIPPLKRQRWTRAPESPPTHSYRWKCRYRLVRD